MMEQKVVTSVFSVATQQENNTVHYGKNVVLKHINCINSHAFPQIMQLALIIVVWGYSRSVFILYISLY